MFVYQQRIKPPKVAKRQPDVFSPATLSLPSDEEDIGEEEEDSDDEAEETSSVPSSAYSLPYKV